MTKEETNVRQQLRDWFEERIAGEVKVRLPDLVNEAVTLFGSDRRFMRGFAEAFLRPVIYQAGTQVLGAARNTIDISLEDTPVKVKDPSKNILSKFGRWEKDFEYAGDVYVRLLDFTRAEGRQAIATRRQAASTEYARAEFIERLIKPLKGTKRVRDHWTPRTLQAVHDEIYGKEDVA